MMLLQKFLKVDNHSFANMQVHFTCVWVWVCVCAQGGSWWQAPGPGPDCQQLPVLISQCFKFKIFGGNVDDIFCLLIYIYWDKCNNPLVGMCKIFSFSVLIVVLVLLYCNEHNRFFKKTHKSSPSKYCNFAREILMILSIINFYCCNLL